MARGPDPLPGAETDGAGHQVRRDRWGRYLLPDDNGDTRPWTRATSYIALGDDTYALGRWERRLMLKGIAADPDLIGFRATKKGKVRPPARFAAVTDQALDYIADEAKKAAGADDAADLGTRLHAVLERLDRDGETPPDPAEAAWAVAYRRALDTAGWTVPRHLIERVVCTTAYGGSKVAGVAGTVDRWLQAARPQIAPDGSLLPAGSTVIADIKTGQRGPADRFSGPKFARQLALYAAADKLWDGDGYAVAPALSTRDWGVVVHAPATADPPAVELHWVDLAAGRAGLDVCQAVQDRSEALCAAHPVAPLTAAALLDRVAEFTDGQRKALLDLYRTELGAHPERPGLKALARVEADGGLDWAQQDSLDWWAHACLFAATPAATA